MFKKMICASALLLTLSAYADVRVAGHITVTRNAQAEQYNFDALLPENDCDAVTTLCSDAIGKLDVKVLVVSDENVTLEFFATDAEGNVVRNPVLVCSWDVEASVSIGTTRHEIVTDEIAITATASRN